MTINFGDGTSQTSAASAGVGSHKVRTFSSNTTYTPSSGTKFITVHVIGGGGGGSSGTELSGEESSDERSFGGGGGGGYGIGSYGITGSMTAAITVGGGGAGGQQHSSQFRAGSAGGLSRFQPSGSYTGSGRITANGGGGASAGTAGTGSGGTAQAQAGVGFTGDAGAAKTGAGGESASDSPGLGGSSGHADRTYGKGADGKKSDSQFTGNSGVAGFVYVFEYIEA
jgi:hypothetical protein